MIKLIQPNFPNFTRSAGILALMSVIAILSGCGFTRTVEPDPEVFWSDITSKELPRCENAPLPGMQHFPSTSTYTPANATELMEMYFPQGVARKGLTGYVTLQFVVNKQGKACNISLIRSKSVGVFVMSAVKALMGSTFKPAMVDGKPVYSYMVKPFFFGFDSSNMLRLRQKFGSEMPRTEPAYPIGALLDNIGGSVVFLVNISKKGNPIGYKVAKSTPKDVFDANAAMALLSSHFKVQYKDGEPVSYLGKAEYKFQVPKYFQN